MKRNTIIEIISLAYVCLMLYTAISKLMNYDLTREQVSLMPIVGFASDYFVWILSIAEVGVSLLLFFPQYRIKGLYAATFLMTLFTGYVIYILIYDDSLPCTCGGLLQSLSWPQHLVFNVIFLSLGVFAIKLNRMPQVIER